MEYTLEALWTVLSIDTVNNVQKNRMDSVFCTVFSFEEKYSRFIKGNFLSTLNTTGKANADEECKTLIRAAQLVHRESSWYFDITLLPILENLGYGVYQGKISPLIWMEHIHIEGDFLSLKNWVQLDFWGIGKWYLIDKIYGILKEVCESFTINFWGDIKVKWLHTVWLEDPLDPGKIIWEIQLENASLCASSWQKRKFWNEHHLINPKTGESQNETLAVFTTHPLATFADMYATALFVSPIEIVIKTLEKVQWLEALIILQNGEMYKSQWLHANLF